MDAALYDLFWENSKLGPVTIQAFARRLDAYAVTEPDREELRYPAAPVPLGRARDDLARVIAARRSERAFAHQSLARPQLEAIFSAFAATEAGSRPHASAGATYPLEIFALLPNVEGALAGKAVHYDPVSHALTAVSGLPPWSGYRDAVNLEDCVGIPHVVVVFVVLPERVTAKYGERGGRFALIEVGHAAQTLALRLAGSGLAGCELGGMYDERVKALLGLDGTTAQVALGYACGSRPPSERRRRRG